jgi:hypothetical protein
MVDWILHHPEGGVDQILTLAGGGEADWLEFKAALGPPPGQELERGENAADYHWHVARSLIAIANSRGGVLLLGVDDRGRGVGLEASDPRGVEKRGGFDSFVRTVVRPALFPHTNEWRCAKSGTWRADVSQLDRVCKIFRKEFCTERDSDSRGIVVIVVNPISPNEAPLIAERVTHSEKEVVLCRVAGQVGQVKEYSRHGEVDEYWKHRQTEEVRFTHLLRRFYEEIEEEFPEIVSEAPVSIGGLSDILSEPPSSELVQSVLDILHACPDGLTSLQMSRLIPGNPPAFKISLALKTMKERRQVSQINGIRWRCQGVFPAGQGRTPAIAAGSGEISAGSRWADFRRLCSYYTDCARTEAGGRIEYFADQEGKTFVATTEEIDWGPFSSGESCFFDAAQLPQKFLVAATTPNAPTVYLAGPQYLKRRGRSPDGEPYRILTSLFLMPVKLRRGDHDTVIVDPLGPPEVNASWLEEHFRKPDDRRVFLELCGLERPYRAPESGPNVAVPSMPELFEVASKVIDAAKWREPACIYRPNRVPELATLSREGIYNRLTFVIESSQPFTARLQRELKQIAKVSDEDLDKTALGFLFPYRPVKGTKIDDDERTRPFVGLDLLNGEQHQASINAGHANLSVVTGPPGTGKSRVVTNVMASAAIHEDSVLFASRNHQAIDAVVPALQQAADADVCPVRLNRPYGEIAENPFSEVLAALLTNEVTYEEERESRRLVNSLGVEAAGIEDRSRQIEDLRRDFIALEQAESELSVLCGSHSEYENVLRNPPQTYSLADVDKLMKYLTPLRDEGDDLLTKWWTKQRRRFLLRRCGKRLRSLFSEMYRVFGEVAPSKELVAELSRPSGFGELLAELEKWQSLVAALEVANQVIGLKKQIANKPRLEDQECEMHEHRLTGVKIAADSLKAKTKTIGADLTADDRNRLNTIWAGMRNYQNDLRHPGMRKLLARIKRDFPLFLMHVPLWATANLSVGRNLPLAPGMFDLLIVDEASQCDISSVIPLLYRARRAMIVGDPMQLTFVSKLKVDTDYKLRLRHNLDGTDFERYSQRTQSCYALAASSAKLQNAHRIMLREHYRCDFDIARYFNSTFYGERLLILTERSRLSLPRGATPGIVWTDVEADAKAASGGGSISENQISAIVNELRRLKESGYTGTVGVVTPFRAQANRLRDRAESLGLSEKWDFRVDTADGFQGGERDVILFSLVGGSDMPRGAMWFYENDRNRFNVASSRARSVLHVFGDKAWVRSWSTGKATRRHILDLLRAAEREDDGFDPQGYVDEDPRPKSPRILGDAERVDPFFEMPFAQTLWDRGLPVIQQYPCCGRFLDVALIGVEDSPQEGLKLDIEVDGSSHRNFDGSRRHDDLVRDNSLIANDWQVLRFWTYEIRENLEECVQRVLNAWNRE